MATIAGISRIRYAHEVEIEHEGSLFPYKRIIRSAGFTELTSIGLSGTARNARSKLNGCPVYDSELTFKTSADPKDWNDAKSWLFRDRDGKDWLLGYGDEEDYPVVTWEQVNDNSTDPRFQVTVKMKSRYGLLRSVRPVDGGAVDPVGDPPEGALQDENGFFLYDKDGYYLTSKEN